MVPKVHMFSKSAVTKVNFLRFISCMYTHMFTQTPFVTHMFRYTRFFSVQLHIFQQPSFLTYVLGAPKFQQPMFWLRNKNIIFWYALMVENMVPKVHMFFKSAVTNITYISLISCMYSPVFAQTPFI